MADPIRTKPARRPLKIYAFDPMLGRTARNRITIDVPNEVELQPGPRGALIEVVDYDATNRLSYGSVDLNDPDVLMNQGLEPSESDPHFHQQMVYAVASKVIENFEIALGRRWRFEGGHPLRIYPHGAERRNAWYDPALKALIFGYFRADLDDPGANVPGQPVFSCLSQDIVAHEMTHAMIDRMREHYLEPTNPDVLAFHEGLADIVAIFQHFAFPTIIESTLQRTRLDLREGGPLVELAQQFGYATGRRAPLRSAIDPDRRIDPGLYARLTEPHDRGAILVAAVFDAFFSTYQARIADLIRIATSGTGHLPEGDLHPDLIRRVAGEAARTAQSILTMCIRAFEYLPPVDVTFGDFLRALVTADYELVPDDPLEQRNALIEAFRVRGIVPQGVTSLAVDALRWPERPIGARLPPGDVASVLQSSAQDVSARTDPAPTKWNVVGMQRFAKDHALELDLDPERPIQVKGFHALYRVDRSGQLHVEMVLQFLQTADEFDGLGGVPFRGGTTVVANNDGSIRYVISKPIPRKKPDAASAVPHDQGLARLDAQRKFVVDSDDLDPRISFDTDQRYARRMATRFTLAALHEGLS